ncbi:hypothetical protein [Specibacter cremeus]|uniref:hypothetical protein n=1 Tax=Specibacter cremeus TaxID=1629051 RepID=UPI000F774AA9|nr:hypothetical protein [Specibacter cremeus]
MNGTPRGLNRFLLALIGVVLVAAGGLLIALATVPAVGRWWRDWAHPAVDSLTALAQRTRVAGGGSWVWIVVAVVMVLVALGMVGWIAGQGKGRSGTLSSHAGGEDAMDDDGGAPGTVVLGSAVAEQALKSALLERGDLLGVSVASYDMRGRAGIKVRVLPRQGVAPHEVAAAVSALVNALDGLLGVQIPVLVSIGQGARARFTKVERVR